MTSEHSSEASVGLDLVATSSERPEAFGNPSRSPRMNARLRLAEQPIDYQAEVPFLAPVLGLSDREVVDLFLPKKVSDRTERIFDISEGIKMRLGDTEPCEPGDPDTSDRSMVLLARTMKHLRSIRGGGNAAPIQEISETLGVFVEERTPAIRGILKNVAVDRTSFTSDDLLVVGQDGMLDSMGRYDLGRTVKVMTFCQHRIKGMARDAVREEGYTIRPLRPGPAIYQQFLDERVLDAYMPMGKIAEKIGIDEDRLAKIVERGVRATLLSTDEILGDSGREISLDASAPDKTTDVEVDVMTKWDVEVLIQAIDELPERTQDMLRMQFGLAPFSQESTQVEIGQSFGVTKSRVNQIVNQSLPSLNQALTSSPRRTYGRELPDEIY